MHCISFLGPSIRVFCTWSLYHLLRACWLLLRMRETGTERKRNARRFPVTGPKVGVPKLKLDVEF